MADQLDQTALAEPTFTTCPWRAVRDKALTGTDLRVLLVIGFHDRRSLQKGDANGCFAGQRTLAAEAGIDRKNLRLSIEKLVRYGYVDRKSRTDGGRGNVLRIIETAAGPGTPYPTDQEGVSTPPSTGVSTPPHRGSPHPPNRTIRETGRDQESSTPSNRQDESASSKKRSEIGQVEQKWREVAVPAGAPPIRKFGPERRKNCLARLESEGLQELLQAIEKLAKSQFLLGKSDRSDWKADIDWLLKPGKVNAILEGKYDNSGNNSNRDPSGPAQEPMSCQAREGDRRDSYSRLLQEQAGLSDFSLDRDGQ